MTTTPTTPRRSQRQQNQPARVPYHTKYALSSSQTNRWTGDPIQTRPAEVTDFPDSEEFDEEDPGVIRFYDSFTRKQKVKQVVRTYGKKQTRRPRSSDAGEAGGPNELFKIGDVVFVASETKKPSIAVVTDMWEVVYPDDDREGEDDKAERMKVRIHWFLRPEQLARIRQKRDHYKNEIYYSVSNSAIISPFEILRHCSVSSRKPHSDETKSTLAWEISSKHSKSRYISEDEAVAADDYLYCGLAVDALRGIFYEFHWESHRDSAKKSTPDRPKWDVGVKEVSVLDTPKPVSKRTARLPLTGTKEDPDSELSSSSPAPSTPSKKRKRGNTGTSPSKRRYVSPETPSSSEAELDEEEQELPDPSLSESDSQPELPKTPSKRKRGRTSATTTPRHKRVQNLAAPTPHSKAALRSRKRKKALPVRPPPPELGREYYEQLKRLPPDPWLRAMHVLHVAARPDALPCREEEYSKVLRSVEELVEEGSGGCVYISGVPGTGKTATVHAVVRELKRMAENNETSPFTFVEINGLRIPSPHVAYNLLWEAMTGHDVGIDGHLTISTKEALKRLTKHFSGGSSAGPGGHACVVLMDELDQLMTTKQDVVYNFFNWPTLVGSKLVVLAVANTMDLPERVMTGRVRSRLGMIRINFQPYTTPQLDKIVQTRLESSKEGLPAGTQDVISPDAVKFASMKVSSISGDARRVLDICRRTVELVQPRSKTANVFDVKEVIKEMQNSPTAAYIRDCSLHERIMLAALLKCIKKEGVEEVKWCDVQYQHVIYANILTGDDDPLRKPTFEELNYVLDSLLASRAMLIEDGLVAQRKPEGERRVILNLEQIEVERVLGEVGGQRWKNALGV